MPAEAKARIRINDLLSKSGWRFFPDEHGPANIQLEAQVKLAKKALDQLGNDFEKTANGYVDYLLLDDRGFPIAVLGYKIFRMNEIIEGRLTDSGRMKRTDLKHDEFEKYRLLKGDILFNRTNSFEHVGRTGIFLLDGEYAFASYLVRLVANTDSVSPLFLNALMNTDRFQKEVKSLASRAIGQANISASNLAEFEVPLPILDVQAQLVSALDAERPLIESNRKLIVIFEAKIKAKLDEIWGDGETPEEISGTTTNGR